MSPRAPRLKRVLLALGLAYVAEGLSRVMLAIARAEARRRNETLGLLFGIRAIARFLGVSRRQAWALVNAGAIPSFDLAGVRCARKASILAHMAALEDGHARELAARQARRV